ncbi:Protein-tyrosine sulfotransferase [Abeliophyllum distichum]|uniref:Protein-tyrosine sulfotransferase n=1 Tax=Abeliophyllum distichum TaxID=126358 RepID=A0ABD1RCR9_9LAMI
MRCLNIDVNLGLILVLLLSVPIIIKASSTKDGYKQCENTVKHWASSSFNSEIKEDKHLLRDLLFFLHIPRTGGRAYFHCFLRKLYSNSQECPRSYDKLRVDTRKPNCRLLSTHDDYSIMYKFPKEKTSAVTILRNPIERVFSTYEFSVEVAARFLIHPNLTSVGKMARRPRTKLPGVSTLDIWPWKYLVPWMIEDLFARRDARKHRGQSYTMTNNSYDMQDILMPLHEYINEPIVQDIVHNGATFQIAGLTNNSYITESHEVRHCVLKYPTLGKYVLEVAKRRLDNMLYVGLTDNHRESATMFANVVGAQVISQLSTSRSNGDIVNNSDSEQSSLLSDSLTDANYQRKNSYKKVKKVSSIGKDEAANKNMTVGELMEAYESCISNLRNSQAERRTKSLKQISPANLTKEGRRNVPRALLQKITSLNSLDMEIYNYAQSIFAKQHARVVQNMVDTKRQETTLIESVYNNSYGSPSWKFLSLGTAGDIIDKFRELTEENKCRISQKKKVTKL